jgi:hypothetical protein
LSLVNEALGFQSLNEGGTVTIFLWGQSEYAILFIKVLLAINVDELEAVI